MSKILALVDGSQYTQSVCDNAAWAADRLGAPVELMHIIGRRDTPSAPADLSGNLDLGERETLLKELADFDEQKGKLARKRGRLVLAEAGARLNEKGVSAVEERLRSGDVVDTLLEFEKDADLVVIGKRGEAADFAKLHLGSNLERVLRASTKPVLVAARAFRPIRRFIVAFDGGPSATKAIDHLVTSPLLNGAACELVMVSAKSLDERLDRAAARLREAGYDVTATLEKGEPDEVIAAHVKRDDVDLIVMGAYGHSRIRNFLIGSTTSEIVRACLRPVLMFR
ncbi:universal stress protein [Aurantimonas sp. C2-6-R+9]|uniref:universal stress protein n=1 Tax=unclassified Aurantimonas TaxID=2638230 RepID=UPI002E18D20F|nr:MULTISPECIES: universal stress protein [unclassified Aurantimonas]MEC5292755.1 universal stress protein [Aurantimonas sp. C2-3-R2]MEC5383503.1 universal stress protein [Aurantimonas sp. C2-6-R+9]MEC5413789.1 universal stress protein [Aurantimonas sp. C2-4-R8]